MSHPSPHSSQWPASSGYDRRQPFDRITPTLILPPIPSVPSSHAFSVMPHLSPHSSQRPTSLGYNGSQPLGCAATTLMSPPIPSLLSSPVHSAMPHFSPHSSQWLTSPRYDWHQPLGCTTTTSMSLPMPSALPSHAPSMMPHPLSHPPNRLTSLTYDRCQPLGSVATPSMLPPIPSRAAPSSHAPSATSYPFSHFPQHPTLLAYDWHQPLGYKTTTLISPPTPSTPSSHAPHVKNSSLVPTQRAPNTIEVRNPDGTVVDLEALRKRRSHLQAPTASLPSSAAANSHAVSVALESDMSKKKREKRARREERKRRAKEGPKHCTEKASLEVRPLENKEPEQQQRRDGPNWAPVLLGLEKGRVIVKLESNESDEGIEIISEGHPQIFAIGKPNWQKEEIDKSPPLKITGGCPSRLDILAAKSDMFPPLCGFAAARNIERLQDVMYPEGVQGPREDLNRDKTDGKFRYDRDFLLQFMDICKQKRSDLPPLGILGIERTDQPVLRMTCDGIRGCYCHPASAASRESPVEPGIADSPDTKSGSLPSLPIGQRSTSMSKLTGVGCSLLSVDVYPTSINGDSTMGNSSGCTHWQANHAEKLRDVDVAVPAQDETSGLGVPDILCAALQPDLYETEIPWVETSTIYDSEPEAPDTDSSRIVECELRALLSYLTMEKFDIVSDQIIDWMPNKNQNERDSKTFMLVSRLVFEKATNEAARSTMYALLCRKMIDRISHGVQEDGIWHPEGKPITGGQLLRMYLLRHCKEDFERYWGIRGMTTAMTKVSDDEDEYCATQKARRLGLIKFIGELFKYRVLTKCIMHEYVKNLFGDVENREEGFEGLCQLFKTVGRLLDVPKAKTHMDAYFTRMKELSKSPNVSTHTQLMLQDVIELRDRKWASHYTMRSDEE